MNKKAIALAFSAALAGLSGAANAATASSNLLTETVDGVVSVVFNTDGDGKLNTGSFYLYDNAVKVAKIDWGVNCAGILTCGSTDMYSYSFEGLVAGATFSNLQIDYFGDHTWKKLFGFIPVPVGVGAMPVDAASPWSSDYQILTATVDYEIAAVPEADTYALLLAGLGVMGLVARRRRAA